MPEWQLVEVIFCGFWLVVFLVWTMCKLKMGPFQLFFFGSIMLGFFIIYLLPPKVRDEIMKPLE